MFESFSPRDQLKSQLEKLLSGTSNGFAESGNGNTIFECAYYTVYFLPN